MPRRRKLGISHVQPLHRRLPTNPRLSAGIRAKNAAAIAARRNTARSLQLRKKRMKKGGEHIGVFTKCWNKRVRVPSRRGVIARKRFAAKVRGALSKELAKKVVLYDYSLKWRISGAHTGAPGAQTTGRVGWLQLGLSVLNEVATYAYTQAYYDPMLCNAANPPGLTPAIYYGGADETANVSTAGVTVHNAANIAGVIQSGVAQNHRYELGSRRMHVTLRNPNPYGYWVDIFYCRPRKSLQLGDIQKSVAGLSYKGNQYYDGTKPFGCTPLECMAIGYPVVTNYGSQYHGMCKHASPQESPAFARNWRVTKKCRVYLPPGGTLEKALIQRKSRVVRQEYGETGAVDRGTEYLLMKAVPEVQVSTSTDDGGRQAVMLPVDTQSIAATFAGLVGDVSWRYTFRQIQTTDVVDNMTVQVIQPTTRLVVSGQAEPTNKSL